MSLDRLSAMRLEAFIYGFAGVIVFYTAVISCLIEFGNARYRAPTDGLIIFMLVLGLHLWRRLVSLPASISVYAKPNRLSVT
jgi:hypothetical protein